MHEAHRIGVHGEQRALSYLHSHGYRIIGQNVRCGREEIDIICYDPAHHMYVFAEVKTRSRISSAYPVRTSITKRKRAAMRRAMYQWMQGHAPDQSARLDLIVVARDSIAEHLYDLGSELII